MNISVAMIVKDEEKVLEKSLKAISEFGFDIIVVDTGSKDNTKNIALKYTNKVYDYVWNNDFSDARNYSISKASNDMVLILDADEVVESIDIKELYSLIEKNKDKVGRIKIINQYTVDGNKHKFNQVANRFFNKNIYKYKGKIHEQVISISKKEYDTYNIPILVLHNGYENDEINRKDKVNRNINLLKEMLKENKEDPYVFYQLGKSYFMNKDYKNAVLYFEKALDFDLDERLEYVFDLVETYGYALINNKEYEKALGLKGVYDNFKSSSDFVFLMGIIYMNNGYFKEAINEFLKTQNYKTCKIEGNNSYLPLYNIGVIYECLGNTKAAIKYYTKSKEYSLSNERLKLLNGK